LKNAAAVLISLLALAMLVVISVPLSLAAQTVEVETLMLDTFGDSYPTVYSQNPLTNGSTYVITVEGTWSPWAAGYWLDQANPPAGAYEEAPMYPSNGGTGRVGYDPFWGFAHIFGLDYTGSLPTASGLRMSLDNGALWVTSIRPTNDVYNPSHKYDVRVTGEGENMGFRIIDAEAYDNYGTLKITISSEQQSEQTSGGFPLEYILAVLGVVAVIVVLLVFVVLRRRKPRTQQPAQDNYDIIQTP